jgi:hypothetical protein
MCRPLTGDKPSNQGRRNPALALAEQPQHRRLNHDTRLGDDPRAQRADTAAKRWPLTFFAVQQGGKCDRQGPVAVNPYLLL